MTKIVQGEYEFNCPIPSDLCAISHLDKIAQKQPQESVFYNQHLSWLWFIYVTQQPPCKEFTWIRI